MLRESEVAEERSVEHLGIKVQAPSGMVSVTHVCKTVPMPMWRISTKNRSLECARKHLIRTRFAFVAAAHLQVGQRIATVDGWETVTDAVDMKEKRELYDLRVESADHTYYTNGVLSHNSTGIGSAELLKLNVLDNYKAIYLVPLMEHVKTFGDRLTELQRGSIYPPEYILSKGFRNLRYYKESTRGGFFKMMHILTDPTKIRGNTAGRVVVDEAQDFDSEHLPEIAMVQKAFGDRKSTLFAGTSKDMDTCLEAQFQAGSRGIWHIHCSCKDKWHPLNDQQLIPKMMSVDGLKCPNNGRLLNPMNGEFVHESPRLLAMGRASFHLPQLIVPEYASGKAFMDIWNDFKNFPLAKFLQEVMGIAVNAGITELTEQDLKKCCMDKTFAQLQDDYLSGRKRYSFVVSGCDWGGSDHNAATKAKQSYTVHTIYGVNPDGTYELIYAFRYAGMHYQEIAHMIVAAHNKFQAFAMGTDNGGGSYYNAYMRDCGQIPTNRILQFNYSDTKLFLSAIQHPEANLYSLHRSDSISAMIFDIKNQKIRFPRWDDCSGFLNDCLNMRRNITETPGGKGIMRYIRHGSRADDFLHSSNYAAMLGRILLNAPTIPNAQIIREISSLFAGGVGSVYTGVAGEMYEDEYGGQSGYFHG